ncbi:MAG TPA: hypothetical protein DCE71_05165 [Parachlamydiales bacterium]|nr:hypothetical protein [Parachlamydiales bacterium]
MKQIALAFIFFGVVFAAAFHFGQLRKGQTFSSSSRVSSTLDHGFRATEYPLQQKSFVVVVIGRDNGAVVEKTLRSIFSQVYPHYRLVYVDDGSSDGSFSFVKDLVESSGMKERVLLVRGEEPVGQLAHLCSVLREAADDEIVVWVEGKDWLAHEWVLGRLNSYYADPDLWMTYGQYREYPDYRLGSSAPFQYEEWKQKGFRGHAFVASHLKTFYAGLFKCIDPADFSYQGAFLSAGSELAVMTPLLELARDHFQFIPEILYIANKQMPPLEDGEMLMKTQRYIRSLASYDPLLYFMQNEASCE